MLQKQVGLAFASLAVVAMGFNLAFDHSIQAPFNAVENFLMAALFLFTVTRSGKLGQGLQVLAVSAGAFISFRLSDTPFFGIAMVNVAIILLYAYGGYKTFQGVKVLLTIAAIFGISFFAIADFIALSPETFFKAVTWTAFVCVFWLFQWLVVKDIHRRFHAEFAADLIAQNRALLESEKHRCEDAEPD